MCQQKMDVPKPFDAKDAVCWKQKVKYVEPGRLKS